VALTLQQVQQSTILGSKSKVFCALDVDAMLMIFFPEKLRSALVDFKHAVTGLQLRSQSGMAYLRFWKAKRSERKCGILGLGNML
jgi:hypothetical protein